MHAVTVDSGAPGRLVLRAIPEPVCGRAEALVGVEAVSLNPGELRNALNNAVDGWRPGWDFAGRVLQPAADGSGPTVGARVVGFLENGAWAERIAAPASSLAIIPDAIGTAEAATLPVAGLTALHALFEGGLLLGSRVLVTTASGSVGRFALQLAAASGAHVTATVRRASAAETARADGAHAVIVTDNVAAAKGGAPYDLVIDSLGGHAIAAALSMLTPGGACVVYGVADSDLAPLPITSFMRTGGARLVGFFLYQALRREPAGVGLAKLLTLLGDGRLRTDTAVEAPWTQIAQLAPKVIAREVTGKVVLMVGPEV